MKLVFVGAVEGSYAALEALLLNGAPVAHVYTLKEELSYRHSDYKDLRPLCAEHEVPLTGVDQINDPAVVAELADIAPDYLLILGWSQLVHKAVRETASKGVIGFHPTLLPDGRGRAAIPWTILRGLRHSGATLFFIDAGMDSGDIILQKRYELAPDETAATLYGRTKEALVEMMADFVGFLEEGDMPRIRQQHDKATFTAKRTPRDGYIDWERPAERVWALIRAAGRPYPGAFTYYRDQKVTVWSADLVESANYLGVPGQILRREEHGVLIQCGEGYVRLREVQPEGEPIQPATKFFRRVHDKLGIDLVALFEDQRKSTQ